MALRLFCSSFTALLLVACLLSAYHSSTPTHVPLSAPTAGPSRLSPPLLLARASASAGASPSSRAPFPALSPLTPHNHSLHAPRLATQLQLQLQRQGQERQHGGRRRLAGLWRGRVWRRPRRKGWERRLKQQKPWVGGDVRRYLHTGDSTATSTLTSPLAYENLTRVNMNPWDKVHVGKGSGEVLLACRGAPCPQLQQCESPAAVTPPHGHQHQHHPPMAPVHSCYMPGIGEKNALPVDPPVNCPRIGAAGGKFRHDPACSHEEDDVPVLPWSNQLFMLENVFVNARGQAFNQEYYFDRAGCGSDYEFAHPPGTVVREFAAVVNLAHWNTWQFYHGLVELVPLFLALHALRGELQGVPFALQLLQVEFLEQVGSYVVGLDSIDLNARVIPNDQLFFAKRLYQPLYAWCGRPSPSLWQRLRRDHLLPPNGLPMLRPDWSLAHRPPSRRPLPSPGVAPGDWVVVVARRMATRTLEGMEVLLGKVGDMVAGAAARQGGEKERVVVFDGSQDISAARAIFRRTLLFIGVHGAALTNLIFMPPNATVVELRPRGVANACYHHLAAACSVRYHLLLCHGAKDTHVTCDMDETMRVVEDAWRVVENTFHL